MLRNQFHVLINVSNINDKRTNREDKKNDTTHARKHEKV